MRSASISRRLAPLAALALLGALAASTTGCKKLLELAKARMDAGAAAEATADVDDQLEDKVDPYVVCQNDLSSSIFRARDRYFEWVDPKAGPTGRERNVRGLAAVSSDAVSRCAANLAKAKALPPAQPALEQAGDAYLKTAGELVALIDTANGYYDGKQYTQDRWAKGKEMHPRLVSLWSAFSQDEKSLFDAVSAITKPLARRTLARIEKESGKGFAWHRKHVLIAAREAVEAGTPDANDVVDLARLEASFKDFDDAYEGLVAFGASRRSELDDATKAPTPFAGKAYDTFVHDAATFGTAARARLRCLQAAPAKAKKDGTVDLSRVPPCPDGARKDVERAYDAFIDTANRSPFP